jgi:hypothetical protein
VTLRTHRCPTELAVGLRPTPVPPSVDTRLPGAPGRRLTAYVSKAGTTLVGPTGWECKATMGADGTQLMGLTEPGNVKAAWFAEPGDPVVLAEIVPACAGCISSMICAFFPKAEVVQPYVRIEGCPPIPAGERVERISRSTVRFTDPAGVRGTGAASGGSLEAVGLVNYTSYTGSRRISCTLPDPLADDCAGILRGTLALSG